MTELSPEERREIRNALDGAVLNAAIYAASLHVGRRIVVKLDQEGRYRIKYAGLNWSMMTTDSLPEAVSFLDGLGIPGKRAGLGVAA